MTPGTRLGPYEIVSPLGAGGMGEVYRARDTRLGRDVAVKVLPAALSTNPETRARFEREARSVSSLNHPHICTLHDVGREGETDYLVMELIEGETLADRLARGPLPLPEVLKLGAQIADALDRAHRAGVVHRDLKPGNVMLTKSGAKLMDFGLARNAVGAAGGGRGSGVSVATLTPLPGRPAGAAARARPKSISLAPALVIITLPGLRSRCTTPARCARSSASAICAPKRSTSASGRGPRARRSASVSPSISSITR